MSDVRIGRTLNFEQTCACLCGGRRLSGLTYVADWGGRGGCRQSMRTIACHRGSVMGVFSALLFEFICLLHLLHVYDCFSSVREGNETPSIFHNPSTLSASRRRTPSSLQPSSAPALPFESAIVNWWQYISEWRKLKAITAISSKW